MIENTHDAHEHGNVRPIDLRTTEEIEEANDPATEALLREIFTGLPARPGVIR